MPRVGVKAHDTGARILIVNSLREIHTEKGGASLVKLTVNQAGVEVADVSAVDRIFSILTKLASSLQFRSTSIKFLFECIRDLDIEHRNRELTDCQTKAGQETWYQFEAEKLGFLYRYTRRLCRRSRHSQSNKLNMLKKMWRGNRQFTPKKKTRMETEETPEKKTQSFAPTTPVPRMVDKRALQRAAQKICDDVASLSEADDTDTDKSEWTEENEPLDKSEAEACISKEGDEEPGGLADEAPPKKDVVVSLLSSDDESQIGASPRVSTPASPTAASSSSLRIPAGLAGLLAGAKTIPPVVPPIKERKKKKESAEKEKKDSAEAGEEGQGEDKQKASKKKAHKPQNKKEAKDGKSDEETKKRTRRAEVRLVRMQDNRWIIKEGKTQLLNLQDNAFGSSDRGKEFALTFIDLFKKGWKKDEVQMLKRDLFKNGEARLAGGQLLQLKTAA